jgi:hypothetical protein
VTRLDYKEIMTNPPAPEPPTKSTYTLGRDVDAPISFISSVTLLPVMPLFCSVLVISRFRDLIAYISVFRKASITTPPNTSQPRGPIVSAQGPNAYGIYVIAYCSRVLPGLNL